MAFDICRAISTQTTKQCVIYTDSQAAITATTKPGKQSGQSLIQSTIDSIDRLKIEQPNINLTITWIPGHEGIPGNEKADEAAKSAAENPTSAPTVLCTPLKSSRNQTIKRRCKMEWENLWKSTSRD